MLIILGPIMSVIDEQKLASLNYVLRTTIMTPVKLQISDFKAQWALTCYGGYIHASQVVRICQRILYGCIMFASVHIF
jgi:hypothetical protein